MRTCRGTDFLGQWLCCYRGSPGRDCGPDWSAGRFPIHGAAQSKAVCGGIARIGPASLTFGPVRPPRTLQVSPLGGLRECFERRLGTGRRGTARPTALPSPFEGLATTYYTRDPAGTAKRQGNLFSQRTPNGRQYYLFDALGYLLLAATKPPGGTQRPSHSSCECGRNSCDRRSRIARGATLLRWGSLWPSPPDQLRARPALLLGARLPGPARRLDRARQRPHPWRRASRPPPGRPATRS
jgi:hypothetical protein